LKNFLLQPHRLGRIAGAAVAAILLVGSIVPSSATAAAEQERLTFAASVPSLSHPLPLFSLHTLAPSTGLVTRSLQLRKANPLRMEHALFVARNNNVVQAYANPKNGDTVLLPRLNVVTPQTSKIVPSISARTFFARPDLIPHDATRYLVGSEIPVLAGAAQRPGSGAIAHLTGSPAVRFTFVAARRFAAGLPVYGVGSHLAVALGRDGSLQGFVRRWKSASLLSQRLVSPSLNADQVRARIVQQLQPYQTHRVITVDRISLAYYDGGQNYLQPVYRFTAVLHPTSGSTSDDHIVGYVPLGKTSVEPVPSLNDQASPNLPKPVAPILSRTNVMSHALLKQAMMHGDTGGLTTGGSAITLGEYANRDGAMLDMANDLYTGLSDPFPFSLFYAHNGPPIVRTQWYWAQPWEVDGGSAQSFLNSVNIAYTQPHGDWYSNTTYSNYADVWTIQGITPGFGAATGGKLATWIIDSCEVVPSYYDLSVSAGNGGEAFTPWFPVFQGLHNVIGFRTQMWLHDGLNLPFGLVAGLGGDVNAAWFQEIAADPNYNDGYTYLDTHINQYVHMGRASTFIDARDLGHSIYDVTPQTASTTLWNFWMAN